MTCYNKTEKKLEEQQERRRYEDERNYDKVPQCGGGHWVLRGIWVWMFSGQSDGKVEIEIVQYKPEATAYFDALEEEFNATHEDIHLTIESPNDASTILRTRFIREDYPDIIGIGGDINYSYYIDAEILADVSDYPGIGRH